MGEKIYDELVAPLLMKAAEICKENDMSMVASVEFGPNNTGNTFNLTENRGIEITMIYMAAKARGNADTLITGMVKHGKEHGHNSLMLELLSR